MAQQDTQTTAKPEPEPDSIFWARCYIRESKASTRLFNMAGGHSVSKQNRSALNKGACSLDAHAKESLRYAVECGGLLFCWHGSTVDEVAA